MGVLKKRMSFFVILLFIGTIMTTNWLGKTLKPAIIKYGNYECENLIVQITNQIVEQLSSEQVTEQAIKYNEASSSLTFNVDMLNSICATSISKLQFYLKKIENGDFNDPMFNKINLMNDNFDGIVYFIPFSRVFDNPVISHLGGEIPVRYKMIGKIKGEIVSEIKEYGINSALVEIGLNISCKSQMISPVYSQENDIKITVPLVMKLIQGKIPENFYGTQIIGREN